MTSFRVRPRFKREINTPIADLLDKLRHQVAQPHAPCTMSTVPSEHTHLVLKILPEARHYWSPQLSISLERLENGNTLIRGLYGPAPSVWTLFTFGYAILSVLSFFAFSLGISQWSLGLDAPILWALPVFLVLAMSLYISAQLGQKVGATQTYQLHHFFEEALQTHLKIV